MHTRLLSVAATVMMFSSGVLLSPAILPVSMVPTGMKVLAASKKISQKSVLLKKPVVNAKGAVVYDVTDKRFLYEKNADLPMYPASTTKLMTAILLVQHTKPDDIIYVSTNATRQSKVRLGMKKGMELTADDALRALLMKSANDVAFAVAESIGGSQQGFARMMNMEAAIIGCRNTNFVTPNGLHDDEHASTPRDIALILGQAIQYPRIVSTMQTETSTVAGKPIRNGNRFIYDRDTPFGQLIGGKTGFTSKAMYCLAFAANQHQHVRISVVLGAPKKTLMYQETRKLLTWSMKVDESKKA
jgi:D-alanyl-D-alanine carboxypeptidase